MRPAHWGLLLAPVLLGAECPGAEHSDQWVVIDVVTAGVDPADRPLPQTQLARVRFYRETASHDLDLDVAEAVDIEVTTPVVSLTDHEGYRKTVPRDASLHFSSQDFRRHFSVVAIDGTLTAEPLLPGFYDLVVVPNDDPDQYTIAYEEVEIPPAGPIRVELEWGYRLKARIVEYDITDLASPELGLGQMEVEVFTEIAPGEVRRCGPSVETDGSGLLEIYLPPGTHTLRVASCNDADRPYPAGLITGFEVPGDIEALEQEAEDLGLETPVLYAYPAFERRSLSGRLLAASILGSEEAEGNAEVLAWGVVEAPPEYTGRSEVDFDSGAIRVRTYSTETGDFHFGEADDGLPAGTYNLDVVPGYHSDASAERWTGEQALDLIDAGLQMGDISLDRRVHLYVRVVDDQGREVEDARVEARNQGLSGYVTALTTGTTASTDAPGTVRLFLEQGLHTVAVVPPEESDLARATFEVDMGPSTQKAVVQLEQGIHVTGQVASQGELLGGAQIRFSDPWDGRILGMGTSRPSGTFELKVERSWIWPESGDDDDSAR